MSFYDISPKKTLEQLSTSAIHGLTEKEAAARLKKYGPNSLSEQKHPSFLSRFAAQFSDFMILVLIAAALISFFVSLLEGKTDFIDPIIILIIIIFNAFLGVLQESKAEKALEALKKLSTPSASVLRNKKLMEVPSKNLVPGDIIFLEAGQYIPADARLISCTYMKTDESALTGESAAIEKNADLVLEKDTLLAERSNCVFANTFVTVGHGTAVVTATGMNTEVGHIANLILQEQNDETPLQKKLAATGKVLGISALIICVIIFALGLIQGKPPFEMFMTSVSLAVAAIPEGLPAIVTIMLSLGVQRMAKQNAVIRKLPAVETLGSASVICSDKTGTLTQNKMTITTVCSSKGPLSCQGTSLKNNSFCKKLFLYASLCNDGRYSSTETFGEATELAFLKFAASLNLNKSKLDLNYPRIFEIPFDSSRKRMTTVHDFSVANEDFSFISITKGAPDYIIPLCKFYETDGKMHPMTPAMSAFLEKQQNKMSEQALRVLAIAYRTFSNAPGHSEKELESHLVFLGLAGMIDPPREEVKDAILTCKLAGITPMMITGDHFITACAIGKELGLLENNSQAITGSQLEQLSTSDLSNTVEDYRVFARVSPEHKVRIVKALQKKGHVVAMTGDGINDAPALKAADIGCAMGKNGTDVAKNASDMILTDDNFSTIVSAIREGRGIYDNIRKSIHFLLSSNIGEIVTIFTAILFGFSTPLAAVQLLWVNLVTDSLPAIALGVEPPEKNVMKRPPTPAKQGLFTLDLVLKIVFEGMMIGMLALTSFLIGARFIPGHSLEVGTTMCFSVLSLSQLFHAFNMRSSSSLKNIGIFSNKKLFFSALFCAFLQISVVSVPLLATIFSAVPLTLFQWICVGIISFLPIPIVELEKRFS